jgi:phospholipid/cholesterol/gamma-HCH transport system substrate-binding protein
MDKNVVENLVGTVVLASAIAVAWQVADTAHARAVAQPTPYRIQARFDDLGGLRRNAPVRSAGVPIGHVDSVALDRDTHRGVVVMTIEGGMRFPAGSTARVLNSGLLGDQYVSIEAGDDGRLLADGDDIQHTQSAMIFEHLVDRLVHDHPPAAGRPAPAAAPRELAIALAPAKS